MCAEKKRSKGKRGLYGWRAFFAVFGCGTLAAFVVMGVIVGVLNIFFSALTTPNQPEETLPQAVEPREDRETTKPGVLNLCELVEGRGLMSASTGNRGGEKDQYEDTALSDDEADPRTVSDSCLWEVNVGSTDVWDFQLDYVAYMETARQPGLVELAEQSFDEEVKEAENFLGEVEEEGSIETLKYGGKGDYFYSNSEGEERFVLVRLLKSGVYVVTFTNPGAEDGGGSLQQFRTEAVKVAGAVDEAFERQIPDV